MAKKKKALIFGISGQDGSYLSELLLEKDYEVHGMVRRHSVSENQDTRLDRIYSINKDIHTEYGDLGDESSIDKLVKSVRPDEIYNLAAQSHVRISFDIPQFTVKTNAVGVLNILESMRRFAPEARFYQASSSEMFGNSIDEDRCQRETTPMHPVSPYGCAKLFAYSIVRNYRRCYKLFASNGILFNHESPRRGSNFVTSKIIKTAVEIKAGLKDNLVLGNLDSYRDWGHSKDYVKAMHMILDHSEPDDFCISTGEAHSVRDFCEIAFSHLGMNYKDYVTQDEKFMRPEELNYLRGDCSKAKEVLGWEPEFSFEDLVRDMVDYWSGIYNVETENDKNTEGAPSSVQDVS